MNKFENRFFKVLSEQDSAEADRAAMEGTLDKGTNAEDFDVNVEPDPSREDLSAQAAKAKSQQAIAIKREIEGWVARCEEFLEFLNGTSTNSIQVQLANAEPDTILDRMKQSEQRKIARVATELAALNESFKGYLAQTDNAQFKYV